MKVIVTGSTGMVGEGVLLHCLADNRVTAVLAVGRKSCGHQHPKLTELLIPDFMEIARYSSQLSGYDACFFCAGISSVGMNEEQYTHITYTLTMEFAKVVLQANPQLKFVFVSGGHTDSTEQGKVMWARVKGKTENALALMPFAAQYSFRPALMKPTPGQIHLKGYNKYIKLAYPLFSLFFVGCTLAQIGRAMVNAVTMGAPKKVLEAADIKLLAKQ